MFIIALWTDVFLTKWAKHGVIWTHTKKAYFGRVTAPMIKKIFKCNIESKRIYGKSRLTLDNFNCIYREPSNILRIQFKIIPWPPLSIKDTSDELSEQEIAYLISCDDSDKKDDNPFNINENDMNNGVDEYCCLVSC